MKLYALIFTIAFFLIGCSSSDDNISTDNTGMTTPSLLPSIFNSVNMLEAESYFRLLVRSLNVSSDGEFVREPFTKTNSPSDPPLPLISGISVISFEQQPMQAPDAKIVTAECIEGGSFVFTGEPTSINVDGGEYVIDNCVLSNSSFSGKFSISARVDGLTRTNYIFDNLSIMDLSNNSEAQFNGSLTRTSRDSPLLDEVEWINSSVVVTKNNSTSEYQNVSYKHSVVNSNPEWLFTSEMDVTAPWTNGITVKISTSEIFSVTDPESFIGFYDLGTLVVSIDETRELIIDADTGSNTTFSVIDSIDGSTSSSIENWQDGIALRCSNTTGLSIPNADNCERALQDYGDFLN